MNTRKSIRESLKTALYGELSESENGSIDTEMFIAKFIDKYGTISGKGTEFYTLFAHDGVAKMVDGALRTLKEKSEFESKQCIFPGMDRIMEAYPFKRNGRKTIVLLEHVTWQECRDRAAEYRKNGEGYVEHAEQLEAISRIKKISETKNNRQARRQASSK